MQKFFSHRGRRLAALALCLNADGVAGGERRSHGEHPCAGDG